MSPPPIEPARPGRRPTRWRVWLGCVLLASGLVACVAPAGIGPGPSPTSAQALPQRPEITPAQHQQAIDAAWQRVIVASPTSDPNSISRVRRVLARLRAVAPLVAPEVTWPQGDVAITSSPLADAWCFDDGRCAVSTGLLALLGADDDRLAAVLAHAIAHLLRGHEAERLARTGATATAAVLGEPALLQAYDRVHEIEADRIGSELLVRAGFDPLASGALWTTMAPADDPKAPAAGRALGAFAIRHPGYPNRPRDLDRYAARLRPLSPATPVR